MSAKEYADLLKKYQIINKELRDMVGIADEILSNVKKHSDVFLIDYTKTVTINGPRPKVLPNIDTTKWPTISGFQEILNKRHAVFNEAKSSYSSLSENEKELFKWTLSLTDLQF